MSQEEKFRFVATQLTALETLVDESGGTGKEDPPRRRRLRRLRRHRVKNQKQMMQFNDQSARLTKTLSYHHQSSPFFPRNNLRMPYFRVIFRTIFSCHFLQSLLSCL